MELWSSEHIHSYIHTMYMIVLQSAEMSTAGSAAPAVHLPTWKVH